MKEPIEYLGNVSCLTTREELYNIGKQIQTDAYNEAIRDIQREYETEFDFNITNILKLLKS